MKKIASQVLLADEQRSTLQAWVDSPRTPQGMVLRARVILLAAQGVSISLIARQLAVSRPTILDWCRRFIEGGVAGLTAMRPGRGRKRRISAAKVERIVQATLQTKPRGATHWSCRTMAQAQGVSPATVQRIWDAHGLQPHRVKNFKLSTDPRFTEKLTDVVGLY